MKDVDSRTLDIEDAEYLIAPYTEQVTELVLRGRVAGAARDDTFAYIINACPRVESIELHIVGERKYAPEPLSFERVAASLSRCARLRSFELHSGTMPTNRPNDQETARVIGAVLQCPLLERLVIHTATVDFLCASAFASHFNDAGPLHELSIVDCHTRPGVMRRILGALALGTQVRVLNIQDTKLDEDAVQTLVYFIDRGLALSTLIMARVGLIGTVAIELFASLARANTVEVLDISGNTIDAKGEGETTRALTDMLRSTPKLERLNLDGTGTDGEMIAHAVRARPTDIRIILDRVTEGAVETIVSYMAQNRHLCLTRMFTGHSENPLMRLNIHKFAENVLARRNEHTARVAAHTLMQCWARAHRSPGPNEIGPLAGFPIDLVHCIQTLAIGESDDRPGFPRHPPVPEILYDDPVPAPRRVSSLVGQPRTSSNGTRRAKRSRPPPPQ